MFIYNLLINSSVSVLKIIPVIHNTQGKLIFYNSAFIKCIFIRWIIIHHFTSMPTSTKTHKEKKL